VCASMCSCVYVRVCVRAFIFMHVVRVCTSVFSCGVCVRVRARVRACVRACGCVVVCSRAGVILVVGVCLYVHV
jgi:uncharacterized membrane protein YczE